MAQSYSEAYYHFVWATRDRMPLIGGDVERKLYEYLYDKANELKVIVHALNGVEDHIHLVCTLPTTISTAEFAKRMKGASAHYLNQLPGNIVGFTWQSGFGVLTFAKRDMPIVLNYVANQKQHHADNSLRPKLERTTVPLTQSV